MAEIATLARPYAKAVFELAKSQARLGPWGDMLALLAAVAAEPLVQQLLESPDVTEQDKARRLAALCAEALDDRGRALVDLLARNKRLALIGEINAQFEELKAQEEQVLDVEVVSAFPLTEAQATLLRDALARRYSREVNMTSRVDPGLVGGAVIRAGDTVVDGSLRGRLARLAESLQRA
ncbi:MAG: F0F1 ATP synthase subunit delta [Pseudomonadales bacterium]|jgi:F-type H+-transporting ATPase subunit delta